MCGSEASSLHVPCPKCGQTIIVEDLGEGQCNKCKTQIDLDFLLEQYAPGGGDPKEEPDTAYCSNCEQPFIQTVVPHGNVYLCLSCMSVYDWVGNCGYCGERIAGFDSSDSYVTGCMICGGTRYDD